MQAIYHITTNELTTSFIEYLKNQFQNHSIDIVIKERDETQYLNSSKINKQYLDEAIQEVSDAKFIQKTPQELNL